MMTTNGTAASAHTTPHDGFHRSNKSTYVRALINHLTDTFSVVPLRRLRVILTDHDVAQDLHYGRR